MADKDISATKRFKKSTAKFVRSELAKTQSSLGSHAMGVGMRLTVAIVLGVAASFLYVYWMV